MSAFSRICLLSLTSLLALTGRPVQAETPNSAAAKGAGATLGRPSSRHVRMDTIVRNGNTFTAQMEGGAQAELTLDPRLQDAAEEAFRTFQLPYAGAVVISIPDGRVLALAGHSAVSPELGAEELALHPWAPAASVFKVVSATALVSEAGLTGASRTCYHGGVSSIVPDNLVDIPRIDRSCATLAYGLGKSQNAIIAKLATRNLTPEGLDRMAHAFGFGETIPFDVPFEASHIEVPTDDRLEFARTAAGFWHSTLSPMHGALLAATVANRGEMPTPHLVERAFGSEGQPLSLPTGRGRTVMSPAVAHEVGQMMELTTRMGTARTAFHDRKGHPLLPVSVAGKTGTLSAQTDKGYLGYSWFIGYAPAEHPKIAFAVVIGNHASWRIKATYVGRRLVEEYLAGAAAEHAPHLLTAAR
ncbi:MAG TPA: penicillin-binding transpeptidase domain-containing protein [Polyangia bacterium]|jgi:cell division protein FtsI/penicillin-binding protein 2